MRLAALAPLATLLALSACEPCPDPDTDLDTDTDTDVDTDTDEPEPCEDDEIIELQSADVSGGVTLDGRCYHVAGRAVASNGVLTMAAGTRIAFAQGASLEVAASGRLSVLGTVTNPVVLHGDEAIAGFWQGLSIQGSVSPDNRIASLVIEDASGGAWTGDSNSSGALYVGGNTVLDIADLRITRAGERPVFVHADGTHVSLTSLSVQDAGGSAWLPLDTVASIEGMDFGPDPDAGRVVVVRPVVTEDLVVPEHDPSVELAIRRELTVTGGTLTLSPGAHLTFEDDQGVRVVNSGALVVGGTEARPVLLEGQAGGRGAWLGVYLHGTTTPSRLVHTEVRSGGARPWTGDSRSRGGIVVSGAGALELEEVDVVDGLGPGLSVVDEDASLQLDAVFISGHEVAARVTANSVASITGVSDGLIGNDDDSILVFGGTLTRGGTWWSERPLVLERTVTVASDLTVRPGTVLRGTGAAIGVDVVNGGSLSALGEDDDPVVFEGTTSAPGSWLGLGFNDTRSDRNVLDNVVIRSGGGAPWTGNSETSANLFVRNSVVELVRTRIEDSATNSISLTGTTVLEGCTDVVLSGNGDDDGYRQSPARSCFLD